MSDGGKIITVAYTRTLQDCLKKSSADPFPLRLVYLCGSVYRLYYRGQLLFLLNFTFDEFWWWFDSSKLIEKVDPRAIS